jgi:CPA2 family monovalent cation:H+ antiporter-2
MAAAAVMESLHLSTALGAFIAGVMLADSPYRHEIEADVEPFRSILLGLFFIAVGMVLDLRAIIENPLFVIGMAAAVVIVKTLGIAALARLFGMGIRPAFSLGLLLSQGGEFGFVLFAQAQEALLIEPEAASLFGAIVTLSMATTPFLLMFARRFEYQQETKGEDLDGPDLAAQSRAIVVGFGRFGQTVAQLLMTRGVSVTLVDIKPSQIEVSGTFGAKVWFGDGRRVDLLRRAGAEEAQIIAFCTDDCQIGTKELEPIIAAFPQAAIFLRVFDRRRLIEVSGLDLAGATREVFESAVAMGNAALRSLGADDDAIIDNERAYRQRDLDRLAAQTENGDLYAGESLYRLPHKTPQS